MPQNSSTPLRAMLLVAFMWGAYFLNYCDRQAVSSIFPVLRSSLGISDTELGLSVSIFLWVYGVFGLVAGQLADTYSKRRLVVCSLAIWSLVTAATGCSTSVVMLLTLRGAMGISESLYMPAAVALTANAYPQAKHSRVVAILMTAQIAGIVGGGWFAGWMSDRGLWRGAFFALGAIGLVYALPYFVFLRGVNENTPAETKNSRTTIAAGALVKVPTFVLLCVVFPVFVFGLWLLYGWLPDFLGSKFTLNQADAAFNATIYLQGATFIGIVSGGLLADLLYRRTKAARFWVLTAGLVLSAPCLHFLGGSSTLEATRLAAAGFGLTSGLFVGNIFPAAFEVVPANTRASTVGILNCSGSMLSGCATLAGGVWKKSIGIERLLSYTAILYVVSAALLIMGIAFLFKRDYERMH